MSVMIFVTFKKLSSKPVMRTSLVLGCLLAFGALNLCYSSMADLTRARCTYGGKYTLLQIHTVQTNLTISPFFPPHPKHTQCTATPAIGVQADCTRMDRYTSMYLVSIGTLLISVSGVTSNLTLGGKHPHALHTHSLCTAARISYDAACKQSDNVL